MQHSMLRVALIHFCGALSCNNTRDDASWSEIMQDWRKSLCRWASCKGLGAAMLGVALLVWALTPWLASTLSFEQAVSFAAAFPMASGVMATLISVLGGQQVCQRVQSIAPHANAGSLCVSQCASPRCVGIVWGVLVACLIAWSTALHSQTTPVLALLCQQGAMPSNISSLSLVAELHQVQVDDKRLQRLAGNWLAPAGSSSSPSELVIVWVLTEAPVLSSCSDDRPPWDRRLCVVDLRVELWRLGQSQHELALRSAAAQMHPNATVNVPVVATRAVGPLCASSWRHRILAGVLSLIVGVLVAPQLASRV